MAAAQQYFDTIPPSGRLGLVRIYDLDGIIFSILFHYSCMTTHVMLRIDMVAATAGYHAHS